MEYVHLCSEDEGSTDDSTRSECSGVVLLDSDQEEGSSTSSGIMPENGYLWRHLQKDSIGSVYSGVRSPHESSLKDVSLTQKRNRGKPEFATKELISMYCCDRKEVTCFKLLSQANIEIVREQFYTVSNETEQNQIILTYMTNHTNGDESVLYTVCGHVVCEKCYRLVYGIRHKCFSTIKKKFAKGVLKLEHGLLGRGCQSTCTIRVTTWMRTFFAKVGDKMPSSEDIHLPSCLTKTDVFNLAYDDLSQGGLECCKKSTFYDIWRVEFPHVKIPKESRFTKCDVCSAIKEARERTMNTTVRKWLSEIMTQHNHLQKTEREKYAKHRQKAEKYPHKYFSLIVNGMDQEKTNIPHITSRPKCLAGGYTLETHITGVRSHGRATIMAVDCGEYSHDSNLTIEVILRMVHKYKDELPPVLYVQMDNTCRDNKNKYTLTFFCLLVQLGIFKKVKMGFLPVGHTHEDIDQIFSCISRRLQHNNALTIPDLMNVVSRSISPNPLVVRINQVTDAKSWMKEQTLPLHDHLKAHQFKFEMKNHTAVMYYKEWSSDDSWLPDTGLCILPDDQPIPAYDPKVLQPLFEQDTLSKLESTLRKIRGYLQKGGHTAWWEQWISEAKPFTSEKQPQNHSDQWILFDLPTPFFIEPEDQFNSSGSQKAEEESMSGVQLQQSSVHGKDRNETFDANIPGIGPLRSTWIGKIGVQYIQDRYDHIKSEETMKQLNTEIKIMASECLTAFKTAGLLETQDPLIKRAIDMCSIHCKSDSKQSSQTTSQSGTSTIINLWKSGEADEECENEDPDSLAVSILGKDLTDSLIEKNSQPPDIYIGNSRKSVVKNRDVTKELAIGMLVATPGFDKIPCIGRVSSISSNVVTINLLSQERAPHKPKWSRAFKDSQKSTAISYSDILLYDFELTNRGCLKKKTREYLQNLT